MLEELLVIIRKTPIDKVALTNLVPILKELDEFEYYHPVHPYPVLVHSIKAAEMLDDEFLRLAMIFHDVGKINTSVKVPHNTIPDKFVMKSPNHDIESSRIVVWLFKDEMEKDNLTTLSALIEYHDTPLINQDGTEAIMEQLVNQYGVAFVSNLLKMQRADMSTHSKEYYEQKIKPQLDYVDSVYEKKYKK